MRSTFRLDLASWLVLGVSALLLTLWAVFVLLRVTGPSDGARVLSRAPLWQADGVVLDVLVAQPDGLENHDRVIAIDGISIDSWARALVDVRRPHAAWEFESARSYTVVRQGRLFFIRVDPITYPVQAMLRQEWGMFVLGLFSVLLGALVFWLRPNEPAARILFLWAVSILSNSVGSIGLQATDLAGGVELWLYLVVNYGAVFLFMIGNVHFAIVFVRTGSSLLRQMNRKRVLAVLYSAPFIAYALYLAARWQIASSTLDWLGSWVWGANVIQVVYLSLFMALLYWSLRASENSATRQQIGWVVMAGITSGLTFVALWTVPSILTGEPLISRSVLSLAGLPFPLAIAIAILRNRLFDIDLLLNRTLVYGVVTVALAVVFFAGVILLQQLFADVIGPAPELAVVASTVAIAGLFNPLRRWVQRWIDRRFYRHKYDAGKTLETFGRSVRKEVNLEALSQRLLTVVVETMEPAHVSLWLKPPNPVRASGDVGEATRPRGADHVPDEQVTGTQETAPEAVQTFVRNAVRNDFETTEG